MNSISINTFEDLHHLCLMYGLKKAYMRYPFLTNNVLATPPPFHRNPKRSLTFIGCKTNPLCVQYFKKDITILYDETRLTQTAVQEFGKAVVEEYLHLRHPYMKIEWEETKLMEPTTKTIVAEII